MAGHNKWSKIKHRKAVVDKRRGKVWTKISKAIIVAARHGGPDPSFNLPLRYAIDEARYANMPRDSIDRAIKKGSGEGAGDQYESIRYEGYAPGGVAILVDALTDNRTRTITDVRNAFNDAGGNVGASGCVAYMFMPRGEIIISTRTDDTPVNEDTLMEAAIEAGAVDVVGDGQSPEPVWQVLTEPVDFQRIKDGLEQAGYVIEAAELAMIPDTKTVVSGETAQQVAELVEALEDLDDVQKVYTNALFPD